MSKENFLSTIKVAISRLRKEKVQKNNQIIGPKLFIFPLSGAETLSEIAAVQNDTTLENTMQFDVQLLDENGKHFTYAKNKTLETIYADDPLLEKIPTYIILPSVLFSIKTLNIPGKLDKKILKNLAYQVEEDLIDEPNSFTSQIVQSEGQALTFALYEHNLANRFVSQFNQVKANIKGFYPEILLLTQYSSRSTIWLQTENGTIFWRINKEYYTFPFSLLEKHFSALSSALIALNDEAYSEADANQNTEFKNDNCLILQIITDNGSHLIMNELFMQFEKIGLKPNKNFNVIEKKRIDVAIDALKTHSFNFFSDKIGINTPKTKKKNSLRGLTKPMFIVSGFLLVIIANISLFLYELNVSVQRHETQLVKQYNQLTSSSFKSYEQISNDYTKRLKNSSANTSPDLTIFDWYSKLPLVLGGISQNEVKSLSFNSEKSMLTIDLVLSDFNRVNKIKSEAEKFFQVIESPVNQRNGLIEIKLILSTPLN